MQNSVFTVKLIAKHLNVRYLTSDIEEVLVSSRVH